MTERLVYLAGPITGLGWQDATDWRGYFDVYLPEPISALSPLRGKDYLSDETSIAPDYPQIPLSSERGITTRDYFDVQRCDVVVVNVLGAKTVSVGTVMEIAWAKAFQKPVVMIMEPEGNPHDHPMIRDSIGFRVTTPKQALDLVLVLLLPNPHRRGWSLEVGPKK